MPEVANSESNCSSNSTSTLAVASAAAQTQTNIGQSEKHPNDLKSSNTEKNLEKLYATRLPWGVIREKVSHASSPSTPLDSTGLTINVNDTNNVDKFTNIEKKKPGEYLMHLLMLNFIQLGSKKLEQIVSGDKRDKRLKDCFQKNEDLQMDKLVMTMGSVAEQCLPSLTRSLLIWHESQMVNLNYMKQQAQQAEFSAFSLTANSKITLKTKQLVNQAKLENEILDERKELPFHPGNDDLLNYIIDLSFKRFLSKDVSSSLVQNSQLTSDNQYVTDLYAEVVGTVSQSRFSLVKRRFLIEFKQLKLNISPLSANNVLPVQGNVVTSSSGASLTTTPIHSAYSLSTSPSTIVSPNSSQSTPNSSSNNSSVDQSLGSQVGINLPVPLSTSNMSLSSGSSQSQQPISPTSANTIKLLMGMKYFRIKMVPIEDFEASFQFLNDCAQYFVDVKDRDIKHTLAGLFVEILVPIIGTVKNEVNIPCLKTFVDILYPHAMELSSKSKHRLATLPLLTCLLCVSQRQFFLSYWFQFAQLCLQQFKVKEQTLTRISLESILRLVWVYMIRIKGEKSSETNQRLLAILQSLFPKGQKVVIPKEMPSNIFIKIIQYIAYEKLDFAMKEVIFELLSIDVNSSYSIGNESNSNINLNENEPANNMSNLYNNLNNAYNSNNVELQSNTNVSNLNTQNSFLNNNLSSNAYKQSKENLVIHPLRMEIGLRAFIQIADSLQYQKENGISPPTMPSTFNTAQANESLSIYLQTASTNINSKTQQQQRTSILTDSLSRELGLGNYFEYVRRSFQDILKTLDCTIGRTFLMTRPENNGSETDASNSNNSANTLIHPGNSNNTNNSSQPNLNTSSSNVASGAQSVSTGSTGGGADHYNLHHANSVGSSSSISNAHANNMGKSLSVDLNETNSLSSSQIQNRDNIFNLENKSKLNLMKICISLIPRMMPLFKESELVEILTRLTIHLDEELKMIAFQTLKTFVSEYPQWRKYVFVGFTNFILKEISDMYPKLIEIGLKMLIQLLNSWKVSLTNTVNKPSSSATPAPSKQLNDDICQIIFHLEGFSLFNLCHSHIQRRRYALVILRECKLIGDLVKCFRFYPYHNYAIDILDLASIHAMKQLHFQCFNSSLIINNVKPDVAYLVELSAGWETSIINTASYNNSNEASQNNQSAVNMSNSSSNTVINNNSNTTTSSFYNIINKNARTSSISNQNNEQDSLSNEAGGGGTPIVNPVTTNVTTVNTNVNNLNQNENDPSQPIQQNIGVSATPVTTTPHITGPQSTPVSNQQTQLGSFSTSNSTNANASSSNAFTFDPWTECLAIFFSYDFIFTKCPQARIDAWPFIYTRLQQLLSFVDPNEQPHETSRTSILWGVGANSLEKIRKAASERDANLNLWKNYLIGACCLAYGSDRHFFYNEYEKALLKTDENSENLCTENKSQSAFNLSTSNNCQSATSMNVEFTIVESTSKFYATFGTGTSLIKMLVPFLKCECNYFREIVIRGLGRINVEALRDLVDELVPHIKDCLDKRQEKLRRMKKRDVVRLAIIRIFELMAEQRTLGKRIIETTRKSSYLKNLHPQIAQQYTNDEQHFKKTFNDYVDNMQAYLDQETDKSLEINIQIRLHFCNFLYKLIDSVGKEKRPLLFNSITRVNLFNLCDKWSGRFSLTQHFPVNTNQQQQVNSQSLGSGLLSLRFSNSNSAVQASGTVQSVASANPNQFFVHHSHYNHHKCYHFYEELELAATKACAEILCCGDSFEKLSTSSPNSTLTNSSQSSDFLSSVARNSIVFTWLSQLLENANVEMKMYEKCKCALPNEIYMLSLNVCIQLLDLSLNRNGSTATTSLSSNNKNNSIFDWIIKKCYSSISQEIADMCFIALARVYIDYCNENFANLNRNKASSNKNQISPTHHQNAATSHQSFENPYLSSILTLAILNIGSTRLNIHETSICLLRIINKFHLQENYVFLNDKSQEQTELNPNSKIFANLDAPLINSSIPASTQTTDNNNSKSSSLSTSSAMSPKLNKETTNNNLHWNNPSSLLDIDFDIINSMVIYSKSQLFISEYVARKNPEQTMFIFCEITSRFENCSSHQIRRTMLNILVPWFYNLELIDPNVSSNTTTTPSNSSLYENSNATGLGFLPLQTGYGSIEGTQMILNNLFYLTCKFGEEYSAEFELLWAVLASTWKSNLKIICRFLFVMVSLASYEMLLHAKRVVCFLSKTCTERLVDELLIELECMDSFVTVLDKCETLLPFYRYNKPVPTPLSPPQPPPQAEPSQHKKTKKSNKTGTYYVNKVEGDESVEDGANVDSNVFLSNQEISDDEDNSDDDDDDDEDDDDEDDEEDEDDDEDEYEEYHNDYDHDEDNFDQPWVNRIKPFSDETQEGESQDESNSDDDYEKESLDIKEKKLFNKNTFSDSENNFNKNKKSNIINCDEQSKRLSNGVGKNVGKSSTLKSPNRRLLIEAPALPNPPNFHSYTCPLNNILFHLGHSHRQNHNHHTYPHIYSYHNNYYHQNHYHHLNNLSRGGIALMFFTELFSTDGADFDWTSYLPFLFHFCLINFDNTKPIIGEHAKKLFLNILYTLTIQNELYALTDFIIESMDSIIDNQSIIFDRKYTNNNFIENSNAIFVNNSNNNAFNQQQSSTKLSPGNCHYNYNFNTKIFSSHLKGYSNNPNISLIHSSSHRALFNIQSAPSSPANQNNKNTSANSESLTSPMQIGVDNDSNKKSSLSLGKRCNKLQKAKDHLSVLLNILAKCKNSPVWPYELITCQNYSKQLTSIQILNEFVSNLQAFLQLCFSTKQVSTISSSSARSFSSPLNLVRFNLNEKNNNNIDKKWSHYALISSLSTTSRHYAGRSLQIYRALGISFNSFATIFNLTNRLMDTVADSSEDVQGYVTEMLLTLKMNANLFAFQYLKTLNEIITSKDPPLVTNVTKQKSKSLKQEHFEKRVDDQRKKSATTAIASSESGKLKTTSSLTRRLADEMDVQNKKLKDANVNKSKLNTKYKHQIAYKKSLTLSLFNLKWQILEDRIGKSGLSNNSRFLAYQSNLNFANSNEKTTRNLAARKSNNPQNKNAENLRILVNIFWTCICLLESDFEHEFVLAIEIIEQILSKIDLNSGMAANGQLLVHKNEFRTHLELFLFKINWVDFPGLQNLLLKGCTSTNEKTIDATQRLLVQLIPYCSKLNFVDPFGMSYYGLWGLSMNLLSLLPTMINYYDKPTDLCIHAAELYCKVLKDQIKMLEEQPRPVQQQPQAKSSLNIQKSNKIEQLRCLVHVMNLYSTNSFGKDRSQWTKCVITYLSEFFQFCQSEQNSSNSSDTFNVTNEDHMNSSKSNNFYFNWIVFLTELLDKHANNTQYQSCVLLCLNSLLNFISFSDQATWSFINEELMRVISKYVNTSLWSEALDLIKLTVSKSSSLTDLNVSKQNSSSKQRATSDSTTMSTNVSSQVPISSHNFFGKKELPGRTLEFDFDFSLFVPPLSQEKIKLNSPITKNATLAASIAANKNQQLQQNSAHSQPLPPLGLLNFHSNKQYQYVNQHLIGHGTSGMSGWKFPQMSQNKTRQKIFLLLNTLTKHHSIPSILSNGEHGSMGQKNLNYLHSNSTSTSSIQKSSSILFENNSLNSSSHNTATQQHSNENLNSTTNNSSNSTANNIGNTVIINKSNSIENSSRVTVNIITSPIKKNSPRSTINSSVSSANNSSPVASSSSSSNALSNSSSNSLNQTSFVTSPLLQKNTGSLLLPKEAVSLNVDFRQANLAVNSSNGLSVKHHSRQNSTSSFGKANFASQLNAPTTGLNNLNNKPIEVINTNQHGRNPSNMDDNNFINNTFSFLDDLDSVNEFGSKNDLNNLTEQSKSTEKQLSSIGSKVSDSENENFPWHAIYPAADSRLDLNSPSLTDSVQSNMDKMVNNTNYEKSRTLPNKLLLNGNIKLSNSFTASTSFSSGYQTGNDANGLPGSDSGLYNITSKSKPIAPKIPVTIGVASGVEALKTINNYNMNKNSTNEPTSSFSSIKNSVFAINNNSKNLADKIEEINQQDERRPSITRIIRSDSFQSNKPNAPIAQRLASNSVTSSSNPSTSTIPISSINVIYDHQSDRPETYTKSQILTKNDNKSTLNKNTTLTNSSENIFQTKRNALKGSSVNNLSNLLAQDDQKMSVKNFDSINLSKQSEANLNRSPVVIKNNSNSIKSLTLPTGKSSSDHTSPRSNLPAHLSIRNLNFQLPNKTLSSSSNSSLNKSNSASDSSIQENKTNDLIKKCQNIFIACLPFINILNINQRDVEETWKLHVMSVFNKKSPNSSNNNTKLITGVSKLETFCLFKKLFKETRHNLNILLNESGEILSQNSKLFTSISKHFIRIADLVNKKLKFPLIYFEQELLLNPILSTNDLNIPSTQADLKLVPTYSVLDKHRQIVWEIGESYDLFVNLRKKAFITLDTLKQIEKKKSLIDTQLKLDKKRELCENISKSISQLMLVLQTFSKLWSNLTKSSTHLKSIDKSQELSQIYENLMEASKKLEDENRTSPLVPLSKVQLTAISINSHSFTPNSKEFFVHLILESIRKENYPIALECFRMAQNHWPTEFAKTLQIDELEIDLIAFLVCENFRMKNSNMIAIIGEEENFNETVQTILVDNVEALNAINFLDKKIRESSAGSFTDEEIEC